MTACPLEPIDLDDIEGVEDWHERFAQYCLTDANITDDKKTAFYITYIGKRAYRRIKDLAYPKKPDKMTVDELQTLLKKHLCPENFEASEREKFHNLRRRPDEAFRSFLLRIQQQAAKCNFGANLEDQMRDRIVAGINDQEVKRKLLREASLTFKSAKKVLEDWNDVNSALHRSDEVLFLQRNKPSNRGRPSSRYGDKANNFKSTRTTGTCDSCGGAHSRQSCKFRQAECHQCHKKGHIKRVCRSRTKEIRTIQATKEDEDSDPDVRVFTLKEAEHLYYTILFNSGRSKKFILDTGSPITFLSINELKALGFDANSIRPTTTTIKGVSGHSLTVLGQFPTRVRSKDNKNEVCLNLLVTSEGPAVLGLDGLRALNVQVALTVDEPFLSEDIKHSIVQCANNEGGMKVNPIHLKVTGDPIFLKSRPLAFRMRAAVKNKLEEMVKDGVLEPVSSTQWATPIVTVLKSDGQPRICGD